MGANLTEIWQLECAASVLPQPLVSTKSPLTAIPAIPSAVACLLASVTIFAALVMPAARDLKLRLGGDNSTSVPTPLKLTTIELLPSPIVSAPDSTPSAFGANLTAMAHRAPATNDRGHFSLWLKLPLTPICESLTFAACGLVNVTTCAVLEVPTSCGAKERLAGETGRTV